MCGRFTLTADPGELQDAFPEFSFPAQYQARYNIAPTQPILVIPNNGSNKADFFVWGLIPSWAKDPAVGNRLINARAETIAEKPAFRSAYKYHRCLILTSGFYEWQASLASKTKIPHFIGLTSGAPFAFAGLWDRWESSDGSEVYSATIITTEPNQLMQRIHNRMPVILNKNAYAQWLDPAPKMPADLQKLLVPYPTEEMKAYPVSTLVNSPANDLPDCVLPA